MTHINTASSFNYQKHHPNSSNASFHKHRTNWHEAAVCAIEIELRDYAELLQFFPEYVLDKNSYRIDFLVIKKLSEQPIPKNIAHIFKTCNLFEIKSIHSSVTVSSYYKAIGYAGIFIDQMNKEKPCTGLDVSISFLTFHYPRDLMKHLQKERHLTVEKSSPGIYYICKETFEIQIIVTRELPPEENLYLRCLTSQLTDIALLNRLADDYGRHSEQKIYINYLQQLISANANKKGESQMLVCEGLLNLFGTSSEELIAKGKKEADEYYLPKINELAAQIDYLKSLLKKNNISLD